MESTMYRDYRREFISICLQTVSWRLLFTRRDVMKQPVDEYADKFNNLHVFIYDKQYYTTHHLMALDI